MDFDLSLYLVTDRPLSRGRDMHWIVEEAVKGGCTIVQLREKDCDTATFVALAQQLKETLSPYGVPLIINDRLDVALAVDADGVHIGQSDMPYNIARQLLGPDKIIGLSVENMGDLKEANQLDVDYIAISPIFGTPTKTDTAKPFGLDGAQIAMAHSVHPAVGIGGMNHRTATDVISRGVDGIAVVSDIVSADSPRQSSAELLQLVKDKQGSWCDNAWQVITPLFEQIKNHPFIMQMADGTLPRDTFKRYLEQDAIYLANYAKEMNKLASMVEEGEAREQIRIFVEDAMKAEKALNEALSMEIGHDNVQPMPLTTEYMEFTSLYIESGNLPMAIAALLPCIWIYNEVGKYLKSIEKDPANNFYHEWINCYTSPVMDEGVPVMQRLANKLASERSIQLRAAMRHAFVRSTEMEILFWQQCL